MTRTAAMLQAATDQLRDLNTVRFSMSSSVTRDEGDLQGLSRVRRQLATSLVGLASRAPAGEGVMDLRSQRYAIDYGSYAVLVERGKEWRGPPGFSLEGRGDAASSSSPSPLSMVNAISEATEAKLVGPSEDGPQNADDVRAQVDVGRCALLPGMIEAARLAEAGATRMEVDLVDGHVRWIRVRCGRKQYMLELHPPADAAIAFGWSHLPSFAASHGRS